MKKFLSLILVMLVALSCSLVACNPPAGGGDGGDGGEMTRAEIAATYKEVADSIWQKFGVDNPTEATAMSVVIPDKKVETTDEHAIANIKLNANTMVGMIHMIGLLYENDAYVLTDGMAKFDATVSVFGDQTDYTFIFKSSLDVANEKVYIETVCFVHGMEQYSYAEVDYDFDQKQTKAFMFNSHLSFGQAVDMQLTADGRYMWYESDSATDEYVQAVNAKKGEFLTSAQNLSKLGVKFDAECQVYFDLLASNVGGTSQGA